MSSSAEDISDSDLEKGYSSFEEDALDDNVSEQTVSETLEIESGDEDERKFIESQTRSSNRKKLKSGGFQSMGFSYPIYNAIVKKGFKVPTPIQRRTVPLIMEGRDVVAMARTGSGKTAAFILPMLEKLMTHSAKVGARALILSPTRELAMQTFKVTQELGRYTDLRCATIVGGDNLDEQFTAMATNPDIIIATPGRLLHLLMQTETDLKTVQYLVFDEADRLFEMGFIETINEILHKMSPDRQSMLFSATLPKNLVEFAKAGLTEPTLVRLDVDNKISPDLEMAFFPVKQHEKEAALLYLIDNIIKKDHQTIIFTATKHHVEYLHEFLEAYGIPNSYIYGSLDQAARVLNLNTFRNGKTKFLIVTDVAARGIDVPYLNNVINYDFPDKSKLFVHRSGRAARAGRSGTAYSFITNDDLAYLLDLQLFLGRSWVLAGGTNGANVDMKQDIMLGNLPVNLLQSHIEQVENMLQSSHNLAAAKKVSDNGMKLYQKTRGNASKESHQRAKEILDAAPVGSATMGIHPIFVSQLDEAELKTVSVFDALRSYRPQETIFEIRKMGLKVGAASELMKARRNTMGTVIQKARETRKERQEKLMGQQASAKFAISTEQANEEDLDGFKTAGAGNKRKSLSAQQGKSKKQKKTDFKDSEYYISHFQSDAATERGYSIAGNATNFSRQASSIQMDIMGDDNSTLVKQSRALKWDKKKKKFVQETVGQDNKKMVRTDTGALVPASYKSDAYAQWRQKTKMSIPRVGDTEANVIDVNTRLAVKQKKFKHNTVHAPKTLDPLSKNYERKLRQMKKKGANTNAKEQQPKFKSDLKSRQTMLKERKIKENRREKNARAPKKRKSK